MVDENTEEVGQDEELSSELERVADAAGGVVKAASAAGSYAGSQTIDYILDVALQIAVEVGRARMNIQDLLQLGQGSVVELEKMAGEPLDIYMNGKHVARGEAVIVNEKFGVRILDIISREDRVQRLG